MVAGNARDGNVDRVLRLAERSRAARCDPRNNHHNDDHDNLHNDYDDCGTRPGDNRSTHNQRGDHDHSSPRYDSACRHRSAHDHRGDHDHDHRPRIPGNRARRVSGHQADVAACHLSGGR